MVMIYEIFSNDIMYVHLQLYNMRTIKYTPGFIKAYKRDFGLKVVKKNIDNKKED